MGVSFAGLLTLLFIALKLTGVIAWSWWLVTMPIWIGAVIFSVMFVITFFLFLIFDTSKTIGGYKNSTFTRKRGRNR